MTSMANQIIDPLTVEAAKKLEDWPEWQASIENELNIHKKLGTGELVTPLPNANIFVSWIVLCYKLGKDRSVSFQKSRLVAQGFTQWEGIDFNNTFSMTAKLMAVWIIAAIAVRNDWELKKWMSMLLTWMLLSGRTYTWDSQRDLRYPARRTRSYTWSEWSMGSDSQDVDEGLWVNRLWLTVGSPEKLKIELLSGSQALFIQCVLP